MFLVRTRWDITYTINKWENQPGYIRLSTSFEYDMENYSTDPKAYDFIYSVEDSLYPQIGSTQITFVRLGEVTFDERSLAKEVFAENGYQKFSSQKQLEPHGTSHKPTYTFHAKSIECFRDSGFSPFTAAFPVLKATLSVWYEKKDFQVSLDLTYDDFKIGAKREEIAEGFKQGTKWTIKGPILPGQGFLVRWDAIPAAVAVSTGTAAPAVTAAPTVTGTAAPAVTPGTAAPAVIADTAAPAEVTDTNTNKP
jgi:hypothetical protein